MEFSYTIRNNKNRSCIIRTEVVSFSLLHLKLLLVCLLYVCSLLKLFLFCVCFASSNSHTLNRNWPRFLLVLWVVFTTEIYQNKSLYVFRTITTTINTLFISENNLIRQRTNAKFPRFFLTFSFIYVPFFKIFHKTFY